MVDFRVMKQPPTARAETELATSFRFLGFLHVWGKSRKGNAVLRQQTAKDRFGRALKAINEQCRRMRTWPLRTQHRKLSQMLKGHIAYFGISGNYARIEDLLYQARRQWRYWLSRRSHKSRVPWEAYERVLRRFPLPRARIVHCYTGPSSKTGR